MLDFDFQHDGTWEAWGDSGLYTIEVCDDGDCFCVDDFAAGNIDDAYFGGVADGETDIARAVLNCIGVAY